ncbi:MAG: FecR family protein [Spirochaetes bacterium]|nr:FecR family protein [Spirochaetota bacterium]
MNKILFSLLFVLTIFPDVRAEEPCGNIIQLNGDVDITDTRANREVAISSGMPVYSNYRIRTGSRSYAEVILMDGTKLFIYEGSVIRVANLRIKKGDQPTRINVLAGKVRLNANRPVEGRTLIVETSTAIAGVPSVETDFGIITTRYETRAAVFNGRLDIANSNRMIIKLYTLVKKEESVIQMDLPPTEPVALPENILDSWLNYYDIIGGDRIAVKRNVSDGIIGHILKKRDF